MVGKKVTVKEFIEKGKEILDDFETYLTKDEIYNIVVQEINERKLPLDSWLRILQCEGYAHLETSDEELNGLHVKVCIDEKGDTLLFPTDGISDVTACDTLFEESVETEENTYYERTIIILSEFDEVYYFSGEELEKADRTRIEEFEEDYKDAINEDRVYIEYFYDTEGNICPIRILIYSDINKINEFVSFNYLINWKEASERTKKLALAKNIEYI